MIKGQCVTHNKHVTAYNTPASGGICCCCCWLLLPSTGTVTSSSKLIKSGTIFTALPFAGGAAAAAAGEEGCCWLLPRDADSAASAENASSSHLRDACCCCPDCCCCCCCRRRFCLGSASVDGPLAAVASPAAAVASLLLSTAGGQAPLAAHLFMAYFCRMKFCISGESLGGRTPGSSLASKWALAAALPVARMNSTWCGSQVSSVQERTCSKIEDFVDAHFAMPHHFQLSPKHQCTAPLHGCCYSL